MATFWMARTPLCQDFRRFDSIGKREAQPNRNFNPAWYRLTNPDVAEAGVDPLLHYLRDGEREERLAHPLSDAAWFRSAYQPGIGQPALGHYVVNRASGRFVPCPALFAVPLMPPYRDDPGAGIDPVAH